MSLENVNLNSPLNTADFQKSVLKLQPRLAVFDCDGTLWAGDAGASFFEWELSGGLLSDDVVRWARGRYAEYMAARSAKTTCVLKW